MSRQTVVFDLDGTLIDTAPDLILATNHVLENAGYQPVSPDFIRPYISYGTRVMITEGVKHQGREISSAHLDELFSELITFYSANISVASRPFPGLIDVLDTLRARGTTIAICTNKLEAMARLLMEQLKLTSYFTVITGRDTFPICKPDPEHLFGAIRLADGAPRHSVMVGDSTTDHATAKAAGIPIIGVTFGYTDIPMTELECDATISHYDDFLPALDQIMPT
ncbi:MAG: phosphoglycolate phosphatase [Alphaproteobacteria bacterium]|jgi:phosphoglycolate phosphatase